MQFDLISKHTLDDKTISTFCLSGDGYNIEKQFIVTTKDIDRQAVKFIREIERDYIYAKTGDIQKAMQWVDPSDEFEGMIPKMIEVLCG